MADDGKKCLVDPDKCIGCGTCVSVCPMGAISLNDDNKAVIDTEKCIACKTCEGVCPMSAITIDAQ